ncbi:MAG: alpha/beta fold hydrolase [Anaerolineae bacterium]|nr:alpha/beta fold hydrolase [Anaerolineae bacterium]MCB9109109.1 alpha/beta fold hydrolase [Anaerolineales bacterium]
MPPPPPAESRPVDVAQALTDALYAAIDRNVQSARIIAEAAAVPVGPTPREVVWALNKTKLYRYRPTRPVDPAQKKRVPLLLVYALINKPYIFDLRPGSSFIEYMVNEGFDVFLLDWGTPGLEDKNTTFDDYATEYLPRAVRKMLKVAEAEEFSMLGYCIGAALAVLYAALYPQAPLRNLMLLTAPLDFSRTDGSLFSTWLDPRFFDVDRMVNSLDNIPPEIIEFGAKLLKPVENFIGSYTTLYWDFADDPESVANWQAMHKWIHDGVPVSGAAFRQWVKEYIRANELIRSEHFVKGQRADLANIQANFLNVVAKYDHIVPPHQSTTIMDVVGSPDKTLDIIPAGHVGLMGGRNARYKLWPKLAAWLAERSK